MLATVVVRWSTTRGAWWPWCDPSWLGSGSKASPDQLVEIPPASRGLSPTALRVLRIASGIGAATGVVLVAGSYGWFKSSGTMTNSRFESLRFYNDVGWVAAVVGSSVLVSTWVFDMEARPVARPAVSLVIGPACVGLSGSF
jgi:hypothetical protein